jgi:hypothetical protein
MLRTFFFEKTIIFFLISFPLFAKAQPSDKQTISGYITDERSGEKLIGAVVFDTISKKGTTSNEYGFFSISLPTNQKVVLRISYFGMTQQFYEIGNETRELNVALSKTKNLEEIVVVGNKHVEQTANGVIQLQMDKLDKLPLIFGEKDVFRVLQLLPGIKSGGEASSGLYVRGGGPDQNLILLDGVPIYNASHLFGFFSTFNSDALSNITMIKGGFPARYGGRASSVLDIRMKEGNLKQYNVEGSIGLISSRLVVEGPIKKDKTSFILSGRRTYLDVLTRPFIAATASAVGEKFTTGYFFHDYNMKIQHKINDKHHLYLSGYFGLDKFYINTQFGNNESKTKLQWGNRLAALRWNYKISPRLFMNTTATVSKYEFLIGDESRSNNELDYIFEYTSGILDYSLKSDVTFLPNTNHTVKFGLSEIYHTFNPGISFIDASSPYQDVMLTEGSKKQFSHEISAYAEDDWKVSNRIAINAGLHSATFFTRRNVNHSLQPRLSTSFLLNELSSIKFGASRMTQFLHLLSNTGIGLPTDLWVPATTLIKPVQANQFSLGYYRSFKNYQFSAESYYKKMENVIQYKEGVSFISGSTDWQQRVTAGKGWGYGAEVFLEKKKGVLTGWIGYTLSWSLRQFDDLNGGEKFYHRYDRRHDLSVVLTYALSKKWDFGAVFVYGTGNAITLPTQTFFTPTNLPGHTGSDKLTGFEQLNGYRMPAYHRLDLSANRTKPKKYGESVLSFSVYNVYNRINPFMLYVGSLSMTSTKQTLNKIGIFPIMPSISWKFRFDFDKIKADRNAAK